MEFAPVVLFTFNRLEHTKKTIEALKKNTLAKQSDLIVFSDGPRNKDEEQLVVEVRDYLHTIDGFNSIKIIKSDINKGLAKSVISGIDDVLKKYGKVIVLEDDLITSETFLEYMNRALNLFEENSKIWSISGYTPNIKISSTYPNQIYITGRASSWGWATWIDRWENVDWKISDYSKFKRCKKLRNDFNSNGKDLAYMLDDQMNNRIDSWAIRWVYSQYKNNCYTVYPVKSLVKNIGNDLSGTHTTTTNRFNVELFHGTIILEPNMELNHEISLNFKKFYDKNFSGYTALLIKKMGLYKQVRKYRNKIYKIIKK